MCENSRCRHAQKVKIQKMEMKETENYYKMFFRLLQSKDEEIPGFLFVRLFVLICASDVCSALRKCLRRTHATSDIIE